MFSKITLLFGFGVLCCGLACAQEQNDRHPKVFKWVDQRSGDCHMSGVLTIYPDGRARWDGTTWTDMTHNKDVWHETLRVLNSQNQEFVRLRRVGFASYGLATERSVQLVTGGAVSEGIF